MVAASLASVRARIEALFTRHCRASQDGWGWTLAVLGSEQVPEVHTERLTRLLREMDPRSRTGRGPSLEARFVDAVEELAQNVRQVRRHAKATGQVPFAYVTWLWRVHQALQRVESEGWLQARSTGTSSAPALGPSPSADLPPIAARATTRSPPLASVLVAPADELAAAGFVRHEELLPPLPGRGRLRAWQPLVDLAARESRCLERRRRLLEAARRVLLEGAADESLSDAAVQPRMTILTRQIRDLNLLQARGLEGGTDLIQQARSAAQRRDPTALHAALAAIAEVVRVDAKPTALFGPVARALRLTSEQLVERVTSTGQGGGTRALLGADVHQAIEAGYARARAVKADRSGGVVFGHLRTKSIGVGAEQQVLNGAVCADGCFELGRSVAPVRAIEEQRRMRVVRYPTQTMVLRGADSVADIPGSLLGDPRLVLHDLASRRLLTRRYLDRARRRAGKPVRWTEARYYVLDGSSSMLGRRGRMRDGILIAELATLIRHLREGVAAARPVVYYRYFTKQAEPTQRVATVEEALAAIETILARTGYGETDIEGALLRSFAEIRTAAGDDPMLQQAQVVLVTDGVAQVSLGRVWNAREKLGKMKVGVSIIALGGENESLQALAAQQRARGESVFYHFLTDATLRELLDEVPGGAKPATGPRGGVSPGAPLRHSPPGTKLVTGSAHDGAVEPQPAETEDTGQTGEAGAHSTEDPCWAEIEALVEELYVIARPPNPDSILGARELPAALGEVGLSLEDPGLEAERARYEALRRDERALEHRFDRWFPEPGAAPGPPGDGAPPPALLEELEVMLLAVAEVVTYLDGAPLQRRLDAIELFERLLLEGGVPPWVYVRAQPFLPPTGRRALLAVREAARDRDRARVARGAEFTARGDASVLP